MKRLVLGAVVCAFAVSLTAGSGTTARSLRVGFVEWAGTHDGPGIGKDTYDGFVRGVKQLGLDGTVREVAPRNQVIDSVAFFVKQKYDLIVMAAIVPAIDRLMEPIVARFPHTRFLLPDVAPSQVPKRWTNVHAYGFRTEQAAYLAGYLGALVEKQRAGRHVVSSVGGVPEPQLDPFIAGYEAGARKADPGVTTLNGYSGDFNSPPKCRTVAVGQIARGSGVVFDVAGACGLGALQASKEKHVWGIGVDVDQSFLGPHILTSVLKHTGRGLSLELAAFARGRLSRAGFTWFGVREQAVGLGKISPRVPAALLRKLGAIRSAIGRGEIHVPARLS